jgi:hypothetical protein
MNWIRNIVAALVIAIFVLAILALAELVTAASAQSHTFYGASCGVVGRQPMHGRSQTHQPRIHQRQHSDDLR